MSFSNEIWAEALPIRQKMLAMPFNVELGAGTLSREAFRHYLIQDALYLQGYARILALAAARAPGPEETLAYTRAATVAIEVERSMHGGYLAGFGVVGEDLRHIEATPACAAYVDFMLSVSATGSFGELSAAILPCFWVYREVGLAIAKISAPNNFYQTWIDTYADESFGIATEQMIAIVDAAAEDAGADERRAMRARFLRCCKYEWIFWDSAYHQRGWPI
jgi:thiaminase (transcriptional activator TenA)